MEDGNKSDRVMENGEQSDKGCWLWNKGHGIDAKASQNLKVFKIKRKEKMKMVYDTRGQ